MPNTISVATTPSGFLALSLHQFDPPAVFSALRKTRRNFSDNGLPPVGLFVHEDAAPPSPGAIQAVAKAVARAGFSLSGIMADTPGAELIAKALGVPVVRAEDLLAAPVCPVSPDGSRADEASAATDPAIAEAQSPAAEGFDSQDATAEVVGDPGPLETARIEPTSESVEPPAAPPHPIRSPALAASIRSTLHESAARPAPASAAPVLADANPDRVESPAVGALIYAATVKAGEHVYAEGRDLIVSGGVEKGAEISADGSIHVYGPLRGHVQAGRSGDVHARVYALDFQPTLVAIAGCYYECNESIADVDGCQVEVFLRSGELVASPLGQPEEVD